MELKKPSMPKVPQFDFAYTFKNDVRTVTVCKCLQCGALVLDYDAYLHLKWHEQLTESVKAHH